jgi:hypothetical protein
VVTRSGKVRAVIVKTASRYERRISQLLEERLEGRERGLGTGKRVVRRNGRVRVG